MKQFILAAIAVMTGMTLVAQTPQTYNDLNVEVRQVSGFNGIKVSNGIELILSQGGAESVGVSASTTEHRDRIKTVVEGGVLKIYFDGDKVGKLFWGKKNYLRAYVSVKQLTSLQATSGATVKAENSIEGSNLQVDISSGSTVKAVFKYAEISVEQNSGAVARISGSAQSLNVKVSSGAAFYGYDLATSNCKASASSGAKAEITVNKALEASASSGGAVRYQGGCAVRSLSTNSGGSVKNKS